ncbi:hypothetical protein SS1G_01409 [Sclerotinia sclerotiorum 1980 UF-70]|uniref:HCP-like protein n=1 Tax=Sclerotinia sclerotiorum (strain ATCC 18683 / 1980 / Ss-1) TaxID=665079 RepID=A7E7Y1_SCLS1|nr:hypothetical protein SS1G_01409 [Sclerotinia sclerotiorum 1980 UF-70]EDN96483.1 hypothetical protein SS1G_01409 [Sclerotinia sclerotiorum 1980 UF-70]
MPLLDLLKKKDKVGGNDAHSPRADPEVGPVFTFTTSDTQTEEVISSPSFPSSEASLQPSVGKPNNESRTSRLFRGRPRSISPESGNSGTSGASVSSRISDRSPSRPVQNGKKISERFGLRKHEVGSSHVPSDLPEITVEEAAADGKGAEVQWEKRATMLAQQNERSISRPGSSSGSPPGSRNRNPGEIPGAISPGRNTSGVVASRTVDDDLQEAIRLHEEGHLEEATKLFARLADPNGANNALSQVLYGLALRYVNMALYTTCITLHGWGCQANPAEAVTYLSAAASNAAAIEELALQSGKMKGGAAKGELVIAIYELANCFRNGWGVKVDPTAAQKYYQTAAELGDTDSMNEVNLCNSSYPEGKSLPILISGYDAVARCYLEGFGKRPYISPATKFELELVILTFAWSKYADHSTRRLQKRQTYYLRKAENAGVKTLGNSWIWKDKYNPKK